jgi:hypothetical protein
LLEPERLKAALGMVGKPLAVDAASLSKALVEIGAFAPVCKGL